MTIKNHWGVWVDSDTPTTNVISNNQIVQFISDEFYDCIDLDYEYHVENDCIGDDCDCIDFWDMSQSTILIGDWIKDNEGLYIPDPNGEYSAIVGEIYTQVVLSKYIKTGLNLCSPCYPGQCDNDSSGEFKAYDLPPEAYDY